MPLYSTLASLSQTAASNAADGAVDAPSTIDQQTNLLASFAAQVRDGDINTPVGTVASAATVALNGLPGTVDVTGTTTVTAITLAEGSTKRLRFSGALTLTNSATLVLPGAANITTAAGDYAVVVGRSGGTVEVLQYTVKSYPPKPAFLTSNSGYMRMPNGLIIQWGRVASGATGADSTSFPITFPTGVLSATATIFDAAVPGVLFSLQITVLVPTGIAVTKRFLDSGSSTVNDASQGWTYVVVGY